MAGTGLLVCLLLAATLRGDLSQASGPVTRPGPLLLRLRRLEEQFHQLQEVTLSHLQSIAKNYNISYNIDGRFRALAEQVEVATATRAALGIELARVATAGQRLHRRLKRLERTVGALSSAQHLLTHPLHTPVEASTQPLSLPGATRSCGSQLQQKPQGQVVPRTPRPRCLKARRRPQCQQEKRRRLLANAGPGGVPEEDAESSCIATRIPSLPTVMAIPQEQPLVPQEQLLALQQPGEGRYRPPSLVPTSPACHTGTALLFPNTSAEHKAVLGLGQQRGLRVVSLCAWLATPAPHLGALLSYATKDGGSELAVRGRGGDLPSSARFVIGDGHFRELPVMTLLDGKWHHLCLTWSSGQGRYRFYVDRRLLAAGSGFQQGYEIPSGGSLVLGWEQERPGRDFGTTEAFVGHLAGFALWSRVLLPGEVAGMATGRRLPRGPLLTLANYSLQGGVQRVPCPCLQHCL